MHEGQAQRLGQFNIREQYDNIINHTIQLTKHMTFQQRCEKARAHIMDALQNREARNTAYSPSLTLLYYMLYDLQSCLLWEWLTFLLSYCFLYLVILDNQSYAVKIILEGAVLLLLAVDAFIDFYCKSFDQLKLKNRYPAFYFWKALLIALLVVDLVLFACLPCYHRRPIRPFRILRAFLPIVFDPELRRSLSSLVAAYKDIFVFIAYYTAIIVGFAFIGSQVIDYDPAFVDPRFPKQPGGYDPYQSNFNDFGLMIMQIYALGTYDNYPDVETPAVQYREGNYVFFIVFIFLNMFLFVLVPGTIIYNKFRENRSKYILVDEIRQQHSLILAFVTLTQREHNLSMEVLIRFLFYFYRKKIRYVQYITEICLKLDDNNNQTIQVNEFMQLSKLILNNSVLYPPAFDDCASWIRFRACLNSALALRDLLAHPACQWTLNICILLACANALALLATASPTAAVIDSVFIWLFFAEMLLKVVGLGPENFFSDRWNMVEAFLALLSVVFFFVRIGNKADNLFVLNRVWRVAGVLRAVLESRAVTGRNVEIVEELKRLFRTILEIMPIIVRFFFLYAVVFFVFGIVCMEVFYEAEGVFDNSDYNAYMQFSNFKSYLSSQYLLMQVLTEASWSTIVYDYCWRSPDRYAAIVLLFVFMHFVLVTVIGTLIKGIFWEIYFTVCHAIDEIQEQASSQVLKEEENEIKTREINEISDQLNQNESLEPNTVLRREIIEKKLDQEILRRIKNFEFYSGEEGHSERSQRSLSRSKIVEQIMENWKISANELGHSHLRGKRKNSITSPKLSPLVSPHLRKKWTLEYRDLDLKEEYDFQEEMEELLNRLILSNRLKYSEIIAYPRRFVEHLNQKLKHPEEYVQADKFDLDLNPLSNPESVRFHVYELHSILGIESAMREKKEMILQTLTKNALIDHSLGQKIFHSKFVIKKFHIDTHGALRKMYLSDTNEELVRKLEVEYFSDVYGNSFKQINKVTLEPLLKAEASLTHIFWNILSYPEIDTDDFFHFLTHIEDQMSNKLLKTGSLVKFVYKINHESDIWFQVEHKLHQETQIRFIKTGVWAYTEEVQPGKAYYARDVFNWDQDGEGDPEAAQKYMKLFYESFETLAFSLIDKKSFFESNAQEHVYDLYLQLFDADAARRRSRSNHLRISSIMLVILAKQEERRDIGENPLPYPVSDIRTRRKRLKREDFILDEADKETFEKLKNLSAMAHEKIIESEGLPFSYILNLMKQLEDTLRLHSAHFVSHIEKALNSKYNSIDNTSLHDDEAISLPEIVVHLEEE